MPEFPLSPLARLVLVMVCLAILGSAVAATHFYTVDLPAEREHPPSNPASSANKNCLKCLPECRISDDPYACMSECEKIC